MRLTAHLLVLFICADKGLCSIEGRRDVTVSNRENRIDASPWGSQAAWHFTTLYEDHFIVLKITGATKYTGNCSYENSVITFKEEGTDATGLFLCGDGVYESRGSVVTAEMTGSQAVHISYIARRRSDQCQAEHHATQSTSIIRSAVNQIDLFREQCKWTIYSRPGYNVRVRVLESNLPSPCSKNQISVYVDGQNTLSWCGSGRSSYTSHGSELDIRFNMSSISHGHGFTIGFTEVIAGFSSCRATYLATYQPQTLTINSNVPPNQVRQGSKQETRQCNVTLRTSGDSQELLVKVLQSSLPSPCSNHTVQMVEGPYQRTSWCGHSTPSVQSMGTFLTIKYNASSVTNGPGFTIQYRTVTRHRTRPCYLYPSWSYRLPYTPSTKDAWWSCISFLHAMSTMQTMRATNNDFFTVYPYYQRMTREWMILAGQGRQVYAEIEPYSGLSCSHGFIRLYDCDVNNSYRYLGSWCGGETKTFRSRSCLAVRVNATSLNDRNNVIFTLKYKYTQQLSYGTTIRPTATMWPWMTSRPWATELPWGNGNPWMNHRPRTTANYWAMYTMSTRSPWVKANHTTQSVCSEVTRSVKSGVHSQVLVIPALSRVTCRWRLTTSVLADSENQIELNLESWSSEITSSDMCYGRYLEVFDGPSSSSPFLARWCGQSNQTLVSTGQVMFLVYTGGSSYPWLPWSVHYKTIVDDSVPDVASQTASSSNKTGVVVGSVFGVVLLVLAVAGALIAWRLYRRKKMSPYQNHDISHHSEAGSSVFTVTPPSFSNAVYEEVKSPKTGKEAAKAPCNPYDTPNTNVQPEFTRNEYLSLYQPLVPGFPKGNVEDKSVTYDNHVRDGKETLAPGNVYATPHIYDEPQFNLYPDLPLYQPLNRTTIKDNAKDRSALDNNHGSGAVEDSEI
ncbi:uncharacterized protein LOC124148861 [Haliotis rufescens]|uniref:uncharacterized protein LOC124148861 n=1 Tax=Haliotis rufescens TaxID=6454 RepID=UPI001EB0670F|nr:uncharacterized protein LOC124148861 [Haliotis rufescens]